MSEWKSLSQIQLVLTHGILQTRILEWAAIPFSRGPRDWTLVSYIAGRFFIFWATRSYDMRGQSWPRKWLIRSEAEKNMLIFENIIFHIGIDLF